MQALSRASAYTEPTQLMLTDPFRSRRSLLREYFPPFVPERKELARFQHVENCDSEDGKTSLEEFWESVVGRRDTEGLMIKVNKITSLQCKRF
jgi:DNA ligase 1